MANTAVGSSDPTKKSRRKPQARSTPGSVDKKPILGAQWRVTGPSWITNELLRSVPLVAIIGLVVLAQWAPGDVQALVAVIAPVLYWSGRSPKGV